MFKIAIILIVVFCFVATVCVWAACAAAGHADRYAEEMREENQYWD